MSILGHVARNCLSNVQVEALRCHNRFFGDISLQKTDTNEKKRAKAYASHAQKPRWWEAINLENSAPWYFDYNLMLLGGQLLGVSLCAYFYGKVGLEVRSSGSRRATNSRLRSLSIVFFILTVSWVLLSLPSLLYGLYNETIYRALNPGATFDDRYSGVGDQFLRYFRKTILDAIRLSYSAVNALLLFACYRPLTRATVNIIKFICCVPEEGP